MLLADFPGPATSSRGISFDASSGEENVFKRALKAKLLLADSLAVIQGSRGAHSRGSKNVAGPGMLTRCRQGTQEALLGWGSAAWQSRDRN